MRDKIPLFMKKFEIVGMLDWKTLFRLKISDIYPRSDSKSVSCSGLWTPDFFFLNFIFGITDYFELKIVLFSISVCNVSSHRTRTGTEDLTDSLLSYCTVLALAYYGGAISTSRISTHITTSSQCLLSIVVFKTLINISVIVTCRVS